MRVVFLGSAPFATPVLEHLIASGHTIGGLVTPPSRPSGRGRSIGRSPLVELAESASIPVVQPATTRDDLFLEQLSSWRPDAVMVASYGEILRTPVLELPPAGCFNVHASLLPRWRGASPIQRAILAGDAATGVTIQRIVLALDQGDILLQRSVHIGEDETAGELAARLATLGGEAAVEALHRIESGGVVLTPQDDSRATYAKKLEKGDGRIDWSKPADELQRFVRAMNPWPVARTSYAGGKRLNVLRARVVTDASPTAETRPGTLQAEGGRLLVRCVEGLLELSEVKPAGKGAMDGAAFLRGARLGPGTLFGA